MAKTREPLSTDFFSIADQLGDLDPERRKNVEVCARFLDRWHRFDTQGFVDMMTEDGVLETPYLHGGKLTGRQQIFDAYLGVQNAFEDHDCLWLTMWTTNDPAWFIYKSKSYNRVAYGPAKGNVYSNDYICFMRVRGDKICHFQEYFNPLVTLEAMDGNMENMDIATREALEAMKGGS